MRLRSMKVGRNEELEEKNFFVVFYRAYTGLAFPLAFVDFRRMLLTHALLVFSATINKSIFTREKVLICEYALGETRTPEIDLGRHVHHLPSHR